MDFFRGVGGMFASSVFRLMVVAGTLALTYFLIVKPILKTTNDAIDKASRGTQTVNSRQIQRSVRHDIRRTNHQVQRQINGVLNGAGLRKQQRLLHCIQRATGDVNRMQACSRRFSG